MNRIGRRVIMCMLLITALAIATFLALSHQDDAPCKPRIEIARIIKGVEWRPRPELNWWKRFCSLLNFVLECEPSSRCG